MEDPGLRSELLVLIAKYIRDRNPGVYRMLCEFCDGEMLPAGMETLEEALNVRYRHMPTSQLLEFLKKLAPDDDYPSLFRRISAFEDPVPPVRGHLSLIGTNESHQGTVFSLCFDPLSRFFISGSDDYTMKLFIVPEFRDAFTFVGHTNVISNICIHPDVSYVMSSSHDTTIRLWSLNSGECVSVLRGFTDSQVHYALFSPDGRLIACACEDGFLHMWHTSEALDGGDPFLYFESPGSQPVIWASFSPGSEFVVFSAEPNLAIVASVSTRRRYVLNLHSGNLNLVSFSKLLYPSPYGQAPKVLTVGGEEGTVAVWTLGQQGYAPAHVFKSQSLGRKGAKIAMTVWDLDDHLLVIFRKKNLVVVDSITGEIVIQTPELPEASCGALLAQNPKDREYFVMITLDGAFSIINVLEAKVIARWFAPNSAEFVECAWSPDGTIIVASDTQGRIYALGFSFSEKKTEVVMRRPDVARINMQFEAKCDMSFEAECAEEEAELAQKLLVIPDGDVERHGQPFQIPNPHPTQESIPTILVHPLNPLCIIPGDDYEALQKEEDELVGKPYVDTEPTVEVTIPDEPRLAPPAPAPAPAPAPEVAEQNHAVPQAQEFTLIPLPSSPAWYIDFQPFSRVKAKPWMKAVHTSTYVPQLGDDVVYIHQWNDWGTLEHVAFQMNPIISARITGLSPTEDGFIVTLTVLQTNDMFRVNYMFSEFCEYLFHAGAFKQYQMAMMSLEVGERVAYRLHGSKHFGFITEIQPECQKPSRCLRVMTGNRATQIGPWQLLETPQGPISPRYDDPMFNQFLIQQLGGHLTYKSPLYDMTGFFPPNLAIPVDIGFIFTRLRRGWYRNIISLLHDLNQCMLLAMQIPALVQPASIEIAFIKGKIMQIYPSLNAETVNSV